MAQRTRDFIYFGPGKQNYVGFNRQTGRLSLVVGGVEALGINSSGGVSQTPVLPAEQYAADTATGAVTIAAAKVAGADVCTLNMTGALGAGAALTLPTAAAIVAAIPNARVGQTYRLRIINTSSGAFAWTVTTNTGLTLTGTMTIAQNTQREFAVTLTSLTAVAIQSLGQTAVTAV